MVLAQQTLKHSKLDTAALLALHVHFFQVLNFMLCL